VLEHTLGRTVILTNRHVVSGAAGIGDVRITTSDKRTASAADILVAPYGMDFALIYVDGIYGEAAKTNYSKQYAKGQGVLALGSPLGLQGSVSDGIISNFVQDSTDANYAYAVIQTDAAINPGNSGGGLFLKSTGELIGINTFKLAEVGVEGLGFAIDINEFKRLQPASKWSRFVPAPRCHDGTPEGECSVARMCYRCENGSLVPSASTCPFACEPGFVQRRDENDNPLCCLPGAIFTYQCVYV